MKKQYINPSMNIVQVKTNNILMGSDSTPIVNEYAGKNANGDYGDSRSFSFGDEE